MILMQEYRDDLIGQLESIDKNPYREGKFPGLDAEAVKNSPNFDALWASYQKDVEEYVCDPEFSVIDALEEIFGLDYPRISDRQKEAEPMREVGITMEKTMRVFVTRKVTDEQLQELLDGNNIFREELEKELEDGDVEYNYTVTDEDGVTLLDWD